MKPTKNRVLYNGDCNIYFNYYKGATWRDDGKLRPKAIHAFVDLLADSGTIWSRPGSAACACPCAPSLPRWNDLTLLNDTRPRDTSEERKNGTVRVVSVEFLVAPITNKGATL